MQRVYSWALVRKAMIIFESRVAYASVLPFLIAFVFRLVPEILAGPWPLGFDTITYYIPTIMNWASGDFITVPYENHAPLLYVLLFAVYQISGNIVLVLKIFGPLLYGLLCSSFFLFTHKGLEWHIKKSLLAASLFAIYFVLLRISWDLYRNMLGLIFFFLFLSLFYKFDKLPKNQKIVASALAVLVVLSHEIVSVIMFLIVSISFIVDIFKYTSFERKFTKFLWFIPSFLIFFFMIYISITTFNRVPGSINYLADVDRAITNPSYYLLFIDIPVLFFLSFGLLLPFIAIGFWRTRILDLWSSICLIGSFWPIFFPWFQIIRWYRWMLMLAPPFIIYAANGFEKLKMPKKKSISSKSARIRLSKSTVGFIIVVSVSICYTFLPLSNFDYPNAAILDRLSYFPADMLSNTVPLRDFDGFKRSFQEVNTQLDNNSVLVIHESMTWWAKQYLDAGKNVINYHFKSHLDGLQEALSAGYKKVYLVWWTNSYGWHGQKNVPEEFEQVSAISHVGIYLYIKTTG